MSETKITIRVRSLTHPKVEGQYRAPGTEWDCPAHLVGELEEVGAIEVLEASPTSESVASSKTGAERRQAEIRLGQLLWAIDQLDPADETLWTVKNGPTVAALEKVSGGSVSVAERDAAWAAHIEAGV